MSPVKISQAADRVVGIGVGQVIDFAGKRVDEARFSCDLGFRFSAVCDSFRGAVVRLRRDGWRGRETIVRRTCSGRRSIRSSTCGIRWCGWRARSTGSSSTAASARCAGRARAAGSADAAGGRPVHPQAHARALGRGAVRALGGEPVLPVLLRRAVLLPRSAVRSLLDDPLAPAPGRGAAGGADPGEPVGGATRPARSRRRTSSGWRSIRRCSRRRSPTRPTPG